MIDSAKVVGALVALGMGGAVVVPAEPADAAGRDARPLVDFHCTVTGQAKGSPLGGAAVCARFAARIEPVLGVRLVAVSPPATPVANKGRWIAIQVKLAAPAHAEAAFTSRLGRAVRKHVPIGIDVMDKSLNMREIDLLARQVAEVLRSAG